VTDRSDVYALGLVLYECLARRLPHDAKTARELLAAPRSKAPTDVHAWVPDVDPDLGRLVMSCLHADPEARPSAAEAAGALRAIADRGSAPPLERVDWPSAASVPAVALADTLANASSRPTRRS
jgi:serine/threonine-protein kinase